MNDDMPNLGTCCACGCEPSEQKEQASFHTACFEKIAHFRSQAGRSRMSIREMSVREQLQAIEKRMTVERRLKDYGSADATEQRNLLVEEWRKHHPEAAKEASALLHPLMLHYRRSQPDLHHSLKHVKDPDEEWNNDVYFVSKRRWSNDPVFSSSGGMIQLGAHSTAPPVMTGASFRPSRTNSPVPSAKLLNSTRRNPGSLIPRITTRSGVSLA